MNTLVCFSPSLSRRIRQSPKPPTPVRSTPLLKLFVCSPPTLLSNRPPILLNARFRPGWFRSTKVEQLVTLSGQLQVRNIPRRRPRLRLTRLVPLPHRTREMIRRTLHLPSVVFGNSYVSARSLVLGFNILWMTGVATDDLPGKPSPGKPPPGSKRLKHPLTAATTRLGLKLLDR